MNGGGSCWNRLSLAFYWRCVASISQINAKFTFFLASMVQPEGTRENRVSAMLLKSQEVRKLTCCGNKRPTTHY